MLGDPVRVFNPESLKRDFDPARFGATTDQEALKNQFVPPFDHTSISRQFKAFNLKQPPKSVGKRKALLIGIDYLNNPECQLRGCYNDSKRILSLLRDVYGWEDGIEEVWSKQDGKNGKVVRKNCEIKLLTDCVEEAKKDGLIVDALPTRENILKYMAWLSEGAEAGDALFFHYSGHGAQDVDPLGYEADGMNETIKSPKLCTCGHVQAPLGKSLESVCT